VIVCYRCFITNIYAGLGGVIGPCIIVIIVTILLVGLIFRLRVLWRSYDDIYCGQSNNKGESLYHTSRVTRQTVLVFAFLYFILFSLYTMS